MLHGAHWTIAARAGEPVVARAGGIVPDVEGPAVPAGQTGSGLPVGVQLVGPAHGEGRLFDLAAAVERELGGFAPPPL